MKKIAIQGIAGSFHDLAARKYFGGEVELCPCSYFRELPEVLLNGKSDYAVMAIENTLAGAILPNYMLIDDNHLHITGEVYIPVRHSIMAWPGQSIEEITEVYSHPMALLQCKGFFRTHSHLKRVEFEDTAQAAQMIASSGRKGIAAIAPAIAADLYGLEILQNNIQDHHTNTTRFVVLERSNGTQAPEQGKISFKVILKHKPGALVDLLQIIKEAGMNMTKIQSVPIYDRPWEYAFFIDALYENKPLLDQTMRAIDRESENLHIFGIYPAGNKDV